MNGQKKVKPIYTWLPSLCGVVVTLPPRNLVDLGSIPKVGCLDHGFRGFPWDDPLGLWAKGECRDSTSKSRPRPHFPPNSSSSFLPCHICARTNKPKNYLTRAVHVVMTWRLTPKSIYTTNFFCFMQNLLYIYVCKFHLILYLKNVGTPWELSYINHCRL